MSKSVQHFVHGMSAEPNGGCTFLSSISGTNPITDSISFDSFNFKFSPTAGKNYLVILDSNGTVTNAISIGNFSAFDMRRDDSSNFYIIGILSGTKNVGPISMDSANGNMVFIKYNKDLQFVWATQHGNSQTNGAKINFSDGRIQFICNSNGIFSLGSRNYSTNYLINIFGELNANSGNIEWSNYLQSSTNVIINGISDIIRFKNKLFLSGIIGGAPYLTIASDTLFKGGFVAEIDTIGNYKNCFSFKVNNATFMSEMTTDGEHLYFGGSFSDTLIWDNKVYPSQYKTGPYAVGYNYKREIFAASLTSSLKSRWLYRPILIDSTLNIDLSAVSEATQSGGYIYFGGVISTRYLFSDNVLDPRGTNGTLLFKTDLLGNVLWSTCGEGRGQVRAMAAVSDKSVFAGGFFMDSIKLGRFKENAKGFNDVFISKISDWSITRGKVSNGPYCAGDSILVPYSIFGDFDSSNYFIAELSDEKGNFDGGQIELGRLHSKNDSIIIGTLPMFQFASSSDYRIRVRSTKPVIQSYYLRDTLRLLIYSRDKADPGPALSICYRDTVQLSTFGGTRWTWSPQYLMDDSTLRQPSVWPERDTVYQIIISDSSGCGAPDTAYKTVYVKQRPVLVGDTLYNKCEGNDIRLKLYTQNTDSSGYAIVWYKNNKPFFYNDSFLFVEDASGVFKAVLTDFCSPAKDSLEIKVNYLGQLQLQPLKDTVVCADAALTLFAKGTGGQPADYQFSWYNKQRTFIGNGFPTVNITESDTFKVILRDGCSAFSDSALWVVALADKINTQKDMGLPKDTVFCSAFSLGLKIKNTHADDAISWVDLNKQTQIDTTESITLFKPGSIEATVKNSCGITKDTIVIKQLAAPQIKLDSLYDACENINLVLTIGNKQNEERLLWNTADTTAQITITKAGNYWAKAANYCGKDSVGFEVVLYPQPNCDFVVNDVCEGERFVFNNQTKGGKTYAWRFGDGNISSDSSPAHQYAITRTSRTYFVTLVASISANCSDSISQPLNVNATADAGFSFSTQGKNVFFTQKTTDANNTYQWYFGDGDSSNKINPTHQYKADSGVYNVCLTITNSANCISQVCEQVRYSVGILDINALGFSIYPNPTNGIINLQFEQNQGPILVEVYNSLGEKILTKKQSQGTNCELDLSGMSEGVYWVRVETDLKSSKSKFWLIK